MAIIHVLLVEDDPTWQVGVDALFSSEENIDLLAVVDNYEDALKAFDEEKPDVVLLDWQIKGERDGLQVGQKLLERGFPASRMILVTGSDPALLPKHPFRLIPKPRIASDLVYAIQEVGALSQKTPTR